MKLVSIGDSITQGFMSGAAAKTNLSYPALIAKGMGLSVGSTANDSFRIPEWPVGLPVDLEVLARRVKSRIGARLDQWDWPSFIDEVRRYMDEVEDYYERGAGHPSRPFGTLEQFHNLGIQGMDVADAWLVTPSLCKEQIATEKSGDKDELFSFPSAAFYRTALNILDPLRNAKSDQSILDIVQNYATGEGIENLTVWLGANNVLGTVTQLKIRATNGPNSAYDPSMGRVARQQFNVWGPDHFSIDYNNLIDRIDTIMSKNKYIDWRVFLGTVPPVSVAPLTSGVGDTYQVKDPFGVVGDNARYFKYYTYFIFDEQYASKTPNKLTFSEIIQIDRFIANYNKSIYSIAKKRNKAHGKNRYIVVDTCKMLLQAAYKRNNMQPTYDWPDAITHRMPMVDTRFHHAEKGDTQIEQGGLFSLDGIHPSAIGQGLIAHEFLKAINAERGSNHSIDWDSVYESDSLYRNPITLMGSIRNKSEDFGKFLVWLTSIRGRGERSR